MAEGDKPTYDLFISYAEADRAWVLHSQNSFEIPVKWKSSVVLMERWRLVNGTELYDVRDDPSQTTEVARQHPEIVAKLRRAYEEHWTACSLGDSQPCERPIAGSRQHEILELGVVDVDAAHLEEAGRPVRVL